MYTPLNMTRKNNEHSLKKEKTKIVLLLMIKNSNHFISPSANYGVDNFKLISKQGFKRGSFYSNFLGGVYDEVAIWRHQVMDNETGLFYGGYSKFATLTMMWLRSWTTRQDSSMVNTVSLIH